MTAVEAAAAVISGWDSDRRRHYGLGRFHLGRETQGAPLRNGSWSCLGSLGRSRSSRSVGVAARPCPFACGANEALAGLNLDANGAGL
ncbi:hypothetical protein PpBr36_03609 [Pyricularia pennisetigena]|uniref:hypothetical protein n=1 Tax=Pyricularia pennisetigena TaxID=1578925 RepID=UPI0011514493|nr:hypothetical protein PpBr36_03609 [Pyricularia pennisetigena]TLS31398.1 hypothetical protein PpBr36_03609 [Pyricularia pennisetigena]